MMPDDKQKQALNRAYLALEDDMIGGQRESAGWRTSFEVGGAHNCDRFVNQGWMEQSIDSRRGDINTWRYRITAAGCSALGKLDPRRTGTLPARPHLTPGEYKFLTELYHAAAARPTWGFVPVEQPGYHIETRLSRLSYIQVNATFKDRYRITESGATAVSQPYPPVVITDHYVMNDRLMNVLKTALDRGGENTIAQLGGSIAEVTALFEAGHLEQDERDHYRITDSGRNLVLNQQEKTKMKNDLTIEAGTIVLTDPNSEYRVVEMNPNLTLKCVKLDTGEIVTLTRDQITATLTPKREDPKPSFQPQAFADMMQIAEDVDACMKKETSQNEQVQQLEHKLTHLRAQLDQMKTERDEQAQRADNLSRKLQLQQVRSIAADLDEIEAPQTRLEIEIVNKCRADELIKREKNGWTIQYQRFNEGGDLHVVFRRETPIEPDCVDLWIEEAVTAVTTETDEIPVVPVDELTTVEGVIVEADTDKMTFKEALHAGLPAHVISAIGDREIVERFQAITPSNRPITQFLPAGVQS